jgi:flagellar basal-body rod protein FlgB
MQAHGRDRIPPVFLRALKKFKGAGKYEDFLCSDGMVLSVTRFGMPSSADWHGNCLNHWWRSIDRQWRNGMKVDFLNHQMINEMEAYMSRLSQRQKIVASNLANIDTPGYRTKDISFHATMQETLSGSEGVRTSNTRHFRQNPSTPSPAQVFEVQGLPSRNDRNNVDLDNELLKLGETSFGYSVMTQMVRGKFNKLLTAIKEGGA